MNFICLMSVFLTFGSCAKTEKSAAVLRLEESLTNVSYGTDSMQKMDVYLPENRNDSTKVLFLIHGGAWTGGDKKDFALAVAEFKKRLPHYAIVNLNYRLARQGANYFPAQENDVQQAINFIYEERSQYTLSDNFILMGASAGAHLALLHTYKHSTTVKIKAVISLFGPSDLVELYSSQSNSYYKSLFAQLIGGMPQSNPSAYQQSSPVHFITPRSAPTLLFHGENDFLVPVAQSKTLQKGLQQAGVPVELVTYAGEGHGWYGAKLDDSFDKIVAFLHNLPPLKTH